MATKTGFGQPAAQVVDLGGGKEVPLVTLADALGNPTGVAGSPSPVDILPYIGDQTGGSVAIPNGSASAPTALPAGTTRLSVVVDVDSFMRLGNGAASATTSSAPVKAGVPYDFRVRASEGYISFYGNGASGTARWFRLDLV